MACVKTEQPQRHVDLVRHRKRRDRTHRWSYARIRIRTAEHSLETCEGLKQADGFEYPITAPHLHLLDHPRFQEPCYSIAYRNIASPDEFRRGLDREYGYGRKRVHK